MFGMGLGEILIIAILAVLFLGPDKLPTAMVDVAKFFRQVKGTVNSAKDTLAQEMKLDELKDSVDSYKKELQSASAELERMSNVQEIGKEITHIKDDIIETIEEPSAPPAPKEPEVITFTPKNKKENSENV